MDDKSDNQHLTVLVRPRQMRVAYLIDPAVTPLDLLDSLFSSCSRSWGGRLFPIVPVIEGSISSAYWSLLRTVDPDWIYSYTALPQGLVDRLLREINPMAMERHPEHLMQPEHPYYSPDHYLHPVSINRLLPYATEMRWFRRPLLLTYASKQGQPDSLIARNFGILRSDVLGEPIPDGISQFGFDDSETFASLLERLSEQRDSIIYPFAASTARTVVDSGMETHETTYSIFVGNDLENWVAFWNHIFTLGSPSRDTWKMFCLPVNALQDPHTIGPLAKYIRRYAYRNGNHPPYLQWMSASLNEGELKELAAPLLGKRLDTYFRYLQRIPWSFPTLPARDTYRGARLGAPPLFPDTAHQVPSSGGLVNVPGVPFTTGPDEQWMQDVRIEYVSEYPFYSNESLEYRFPPRCGIAPLFCALPGRVDANGHLSYATRSRDPLFLKIPGDQDIIFAAVGCGRRGGYDGNLRGQDIAPVYGYQSPSDKARYCRGVLDLFGGIQFAHQTFETRFWRETFFQLAGLGGRELNTATSTVHRMIAKHPERWSIDESAVREEEIKRIEKEVTKLAQYVRVRENEATFQFLEERLAKERAEFRQEHQNSLASDPIDPVQDLAEIRRDLRSALQAFVDAKVLRQGTNARCKHCGSRIWQEISSLQQEFRCIGCGALVHTAVESTWYYRLNTLVRSAIVQHGTVALIGALAAAREQARSSFMYSPGLVFFEQYEDLEPVAELDIICLVDGALWVGEVKTNTAEFKRKEIEKLVREARKIDADKAFVYAIEGDQDGLHRRCEQASESSSIPLIQLRPSSWNLAASFHIGPMTVTRVL